MGSCDNKMRGGQLAISLLLLLHSQDAWSAPNPKVNPILCTMTHCLVQFTQCSLDAECMDVLNCLRGCDPTDAGCGFTCGLGTESGKNPHFIALLECMVDNGCMKKYPESGNYLATGDWWTVWGQNCGEDDDLGSWTGAYYWVP